MEIQGYVPGGGDRNDSNARSSQSGDQQRFRVSEQKPGNRRQNAGPVAPMKTDRSQSIQILFKIRRARRAGILAEEPQFG